MSGFFSFFLLVSVSFSLSFLHLQVLEMLGAICLVPSGHKMILEAMSHFRFFASERARFQTIVMDLKHEWKQSCVELKVSVRVCECACV